MQIPVSIVSSVIQNKKPHTIAGTVILPAATDVVQLEYLVATVQGKLRSGRAGPFVKVEGCCD
jgi:hypothetical protein